MKPCAEYMSYSDWKAIQQLMRTEMWDYKLRGYYMIFEGDTYYLKKIPGSLPYDIRCHRRQ